MVGRHLLMLSRTREMVDQLYKFSQHRQITITTATELDAPRDIENWGQFEMLVADGISSSSLKCVLSANPIRWVHSTWAGVDKLMIPEITQSDILLSRAKGVYNKPLAEYAIAAILHFNKQIERLREGKVEQLWDRFYMDTVLGKRLGILGFGSIGQDVAKAAKLGFDMEVIGIKRTDTGPHEFANEIRTISDLDTILPSLDFLVMVLPSTPETENIIGEHELSLMKPTAVLVNIGRGSTLDEFALFKALHAGRLRGAALDVFKEEPLPPDHFLWTTPNLLISPHNADLVPVSVTLASECFLRNLECYLEGRPLLAPVDKTLGY